MYYRHKYSSSNRTEIFTNVHLLGKPHRDAIAEADTAVLSTLGYSEFRSIKNICRYRYTIFKLIAVTGTKVILSVIMQQLHTTVGIKLSMGTSSAFSMILNDL